MLANPSEEASMQVKLSVGILIVVYLAAVTTANLLASHYGPTITPYTALGLIGLSLIVRDRLADAFGPSRWLRQAALIIAGSLLAYLVNRDAAQIALASCIAFGASESVEGVLYFLLRRESWIERANKSGIVGAAIDSFLFPTIAFHAVLWTTIFGQFTAKTAGCFVFSVLLARVRVRRSPAVGVVA
jgi:uncharacterized PurR-regulated membrane protein YhhQ (DUF165 family)